MSLSLGELISSHRSRRNLTLADLSELSGVSKSTISLIETGETKRPSYATWRKIAEAIDIAPSIIINAFVDTTHHPKTLELVLAEVIHEGWEALVAKVAAHYLESPKIDTFRALDHIASTARDTENKRIKRILCDTIISFARSRGIPSYLANALYERYLVERDDFSRFEETYRRGKELLLYVEHLYVEDRIDYYYKMGVHANILDLHDESIDLCRLGLREDRSYNRPKASAYISLFNSCIYFGDFHVANIYLKEYENSQYADFRKNHFRATLLAKKGQHEDAISLFNVCLNETDREGRISIVVDLMESYLETGKTDDLMLLIETEDQFLPERMPQHPYRIKTLAQYYRRKALCLISMERYDQGFHSLIDSIKYYKHIGIATEVIEGIRLFLRHHRTNNKNLSFEHMELIENICDNIL
ncbi:helix-turn-helix domain-containing protein [Brevibacillus porteri]|uniref:helix-turn-helix domain-containing protein n=1 Tax=Brevibacillus porteri TaxID=2126350 RepID=UPI003D247CF2